MLEVTERKNEKYKKKEKNATKMKKLGGKEIKIQKKTYFKYEALL